MVEHKRNAEAHEIRQFGGERFGACPKLRMQPDSAHPRRQLTQFVESNTAGISVAGWRTHLGEPKADDPAGRPGVKRLVGDVSVRDSDALQGAVRL